MLIMEKKENYSFPSEEELKEIREKTTILVYQQENNLPVEEVAGKIEIPLNKTYDILLGKIKGFQLNELANYLEKLHVPFEVIVRNDKAGEVKRVR
ncbi:916_t:CDS:2 [Entrophospora sp. SA101]|nr:2710_t:CDS:2 [Entrophospora sp. SA101]CAJ0749859.1 916_t:CDS:2 [Entrophospora sp. SA101]CAJ0842144.1 881_t:CDS:2 [Entrophospora sp. SA101]